MSKAEYIAVVEDEPTQRELIAAYLREHNLLAETATTGADLSKLLDESEPMLIVLDLHLGQEDGLDILRQVRSRSDVPVIIVTGHRIDEIDRIIGFELGADDYVPKPYSPRELLARIRAVLRRQEMSRKSLSKSEERVGFLFAGWRLDKRTEACSTRHKSRSH